MWKILIKLSVLTIVLYAISFCKDRSTEINILSPRDSLYRIEKIDSINSLYVIYASKRNKKFKIVSTKQFSNGDQIAINGFYDLKLYSLLYPEDINLIQSPVGCTKLDSLTKICVEDSILDINSAENLKGLFFQK